LLMSKIQNSTWTSTHFELRMVSPFFDVESKFLLAPELTDVDISASYMHNKHKRYPSPVANDKIC
jgi:hypothetical protein